MDIKPFRKSPCGQLVRTIGDAWAFVPDPLPPLLDLGLHVDRIAEASEYLGELRGLGRQLTNPYLLVRPLQRKEALSSSSIEGTYTTLTELLVFEAGVENAARRDDNKEVGNYVRALDHGITRLAELPVCNRLIRELHTELLRGLPPHRREGGEPGQFKKAQNWIGGSRTDPSKARFVPPPPNESVQAMSDLEKFINDEKRPRIQPLVFLALVHYQFETIHPFPDGNGRVGRLLIPLLLHSKKLLPQPLLYMSPFFETNKNDYIDRMYLVSRDGDWSGWIDFFLRGVIDSSRSAIETIGKLLDLHQTYIERLRKTRASGILLRLVESLFDRPVLSIPAAQTLLGVTYRAAKLNVSRLINEGVLQELAGGQRPKFFIAREIFDILNR